MPIVFVHGVNNRDGAEYQESESSRHGFLREYVAPQLALDGSRLLIASPYWGQFGAKFAWNMAVLPDPDRNAQSFGADSEATGRVYELIANSGAVRDVAAEARRDFQSAVDLLYTAAMADVQDEAEARELARSYQLAADYTEAHPKPDWVNQATSDNFVDLLHYYSTASSIQSFGGGGFLDKLKEAAARVVNTPADALSAAGGRFIRNGLNTTFTRFAGDAFVYFAYRGTQAASGPIVSVVLDALRQAAAGRSAKDDKLIVIAHSFGGAIIYDIMTHFDPAIEIDCLITVGSQVGLFEEMKAYIGSQAGIPSNPKVDRIPRPASVKRWLNVYDTNDVLSYRLEPIMAGVSDFHYDTGYGSFGAHGGYFMRPGFYRRLAQRLSQA